MGRGLREEDHANACSAWADRLGALGLWPSSTRRETAGVIDCMPRRWTMSDKRLVERLALGAAVGVAGTIALQGLMIATQR